MNHLADPSFQGMNRVSVLSFENEDDERSHSENYLPKIEIKDYNVMIAWKNFFGQRIKNNKTTYENIRKIVTGQGDDYTAGCLLYYSYSKEIFKMIAINLVNSRH